MKTIEEIFGDKSSTGHFNQDDSYGQTEENIFCGRLFDTIIHNIDEMPSFGEGYLKRNPVLLAGIIQAMILEQNAKHLINTLQMSCAVQIDTMQKNHDAMLEELRAIRKAVKND